MAEKRSRDTAPGEDGTTYSMLRNMGPAGDSALLALINASWIEGRLPTRWKSAVIKPIPKPKEPGKTRPISLLSCTAKTAERMVLNRLKWRLGEPHPNIYGFTNGKSAGDSIASLLSLANNRPAVVVFLDLEKAFELASPTAIADALARKGVSGRLLKWTYDYLSSRNARVSFQGHKSSILDFENGTPQGGVLSPTLFNVLMEALVSLPLHRNVTLLSYADDLALVATGVGDRVARAQAGLDAVTRACKELGLKVSAEKSRAMTIMSSTPDRNLRIQGVQLEWTTTYQYLGVWIDQRLTFRKEVEYLLERTSNRLSVMAAMTNTRAGATHRVLRLYYVQAVRSLVDYAAVALVSLADTNKKALETIQNRAMRQIAGAPRWTKLEALRAETGLPSLTLRVEQLTATLVARTVNCSADTPARELFIRSLPQDQALFAGKTWLRCTTRAVHLALPGVDLVKRGKDDKAENYAIPPPWAPANARFYIRPLPCSKSMCSREMIHARTKDIFAHLGTENVRTYYTDGSVDRDAGKTAAAFVTENEIYGWRTSDTCSTLQTELVGISTALVHVKHRVDKTVTLLTDSMTALQTLQRTSPRDNVRLVTSTLQLLKELKDEGKSVTLAWIPSHVGIPGNEAADDAAKKALTQERVKINVPLSLQQVKRLARTTTTVRARGLLRGEEDSSASLTWYALATNHEPLSLPASVTRKDRVSLTRLRLGFPTVRSLGEDYEGELCAHCMDFVEEPLVHYLLDCDVTAPLRTLAAKLGYTASGDRPRDAAKLVRYITDDTRTTLETLRLFDPPR